MSLDIMGIISQAFGMMKSRFGALTGIWLLYFVILAVTVLLFFGSMFASMMNFATMEDPTALVGGMFGSIILFYVFYLLLNFAQTASLTHQASPVHRPAFAESLTVGFKSILTLLGLTLLLIVGYIAALIPVGILGFIFALLGDFGSILFAIVVLLGAVYVACRLSIMVPIIAVDGEMNPITAVTRSWKLTKGHALAIFLAILAITIAVSVLVFLLIAVFGGTLAAMADPAIGASDGGIGATVIALSLVFVLLWAALVIFSSCFVASLHAALAGPRNTAETFA